MAATLESMIQTIDSPDQEHKDRTAAYVKVILETAEMPEEEAAAEETLADLVRIMGAFDTKVMQITSAKPFDDAWKAVREDAAAGYQKDTLHKMAAAKTAIRRQFKKYESGSRKVAVPKFFVKRRSTRPFGLRYRGIVSEDKVLGLESRPRFRDGKEYRLCYKDVEAVLEQAALKDDFTEYICYEICDTVKLFESYGQEYGKFYLELSPDFFRAKKNTAVLKQALKDTGADQSKIGLIVPGALLAKKPKMILAVLLMLKESGVQLVLDEYKAGILTAEELHTYGFLAVIPAYPEKKIAKKTRKKKASATEADAQTETAVQTEAAAPAVPAEGTAYYEDKVKAAWKTELAALKEKGIQIWTGCGEAELLKELADCTADAAFTGDYDTEDVWAKKLSNGLAK